MYRGNQGESDGEQDQTQSGQARLSQPLDHPPKKARANEDSHPSQIHHEEADVGFSDGKPIREK